MCTSVHDLLRYIELYRHKYLGMDLDIYFSYKPYLLHNQYLKHIQVYNRNMDLLGILVNMSIGHQNIWHLPRKAMDYKDLIAG